MSLKTVGVVVIAVLAITAVWASGASAKIATERAEIYVKDPAGSAAKTLTGSTTADTEIVDHTGTGKLFTLKGTIGTGPTVSIHLTGTGINCLECKAENKEVTGKAGAVAVGTGRLEFTGVTAMEPEGCIVSSETGTPGVVVTKPLTLHADWMHEGKAYVNFFPTSGTVFATLKVNNGGCTAVANSYNVTGSVFGEAKNKTGVFAKSQEIEVSPAIQKTTEAELKLGGKLAELTGTAAFSLTNAAKEKVEFAVQP